MSARYADLVEREEGVRELGTVLNSVRAIAASRAQQAREAIRAVDRYSVGLVAALGTLADLLPTGGDVGGRVATARVVFGAEEGFVGAFSERILDGIGSGELLFLIGSRAVSIATEGGTAIHWSTASSGHLAAIPRLADTIAQALYARVAVGRIGRIVVRYADYRSGGTYQIRDDQLLPLDETALRSGRQRQAPLMQRPERAVFGDIGDDYVHARLCRAALHSLAAENETRVETMARARREIDRRLAELDQQIRLMRHEQITDEIIELFGAGPR